MDRQLPDNEQRPAGGEPQTGRDFAARRTVLKGISSLPIVATLASGRSAAAASALNCATTVATPETADVRTFLLSEDPMVQIPGSGNPPLYTIGPFGDGLRIYTLTADDGTSRTYTEATFLVDADGDGTPGEARFLLASCYTSFVTAQVL